MQTCSSCGKEVEPVNHNNRGWRCPNCWERFVEPPTTETQPTNVPPMSREHVTDGSPCWCNPEIRQVEGTDTELVIHRDESGALIEESAHPTGTPPSMDETKPVSTPAPDTPKTPKGSKSK